MSSLTRLPPPPLPRPAPGHPLTVKILPRRKISDTDFLPREPIYISSELLSRHFHMKQEEVASALGVSLTSFKAACRRLGLKKWPYLRSYAEERQSSGSEGDEKDDKDKAENRPGLAEDKLGLWGELLEEALKHVESKECVKPAAKRRRVGQGYNVE